MLQGLCGSKTVQKVLFYLFVNGKCYGNELSRLLGTSLTPLQKALMRLEDGGILLSQYEGKTRLYRFNPAFPLLVELEQMLKKAYTLLPPQEKKLYAFVKHQQKTSIRQQDQLLRSCWKKLSVIHQMSFHAKGSWNGKGNCVVSVTQEGDSVLVFHEKGSWKDKEGREFSFSNVFRWTLDRRAGMISLEHLRRGVNHPVFLFHLVPSGKGTLNSSDPHLCEQDTYFGQLTCNERTLHLSWRVIGLKKNEEIDYYYS